MESAPIQALYEPPLAAKPQLREKPHQGVPSKNPAWHQESSVCKFTVTLGLQATVVENGVGQTYSARYYNPATGRFLSRDPLDGDATHPASLHKYLYAGGDPVNALDPSGRETLMEQVVIYAKRVLPYAAWAYACGMAIKNMYDTINDALDNALNQPGHKYVSEWDLVKATYATGAACAGPGVLKLYKSY